VLKIQNALEQAGIHLTDGEVREIGGDRNSQVSGLS
jgi:hypothetical protein